MRALTWSLLHFLWQGAAIAALAAAAMSLFRESTTRYLIGVGALALMFMSFGVTFALLSETPSGDITGSLTMAAGYSPNDAEVARTLPSPAFMTPAIDRPASPERDFAWVARGWLAGVCLLALRIAFGLLLLEQLRRRNLSALPVEIVERCRALQQRLGISRVVRYCECRLVAVPSVIGFVRPIVLLPMRALTGLSAEQLEAVIAHELGHVKRFDVAVNFFQVIAETLFFFHPAVWWLNKRIRADREDCCDDVAIAACGRKVSYARALATMEEWRDAPALAMAATGSDVGTRVARLLGISERKPSSRSAGVFTASLVLMAALMAGAASIGIANPALATSPFSQRVAQADVPAPAARAAPAPVAAPAPAAAPRAEAHPRVAANPKPAAAPKPPGAATPAVAPRGGSFIAQMKSAGFDNIDVDNLIALKVHDVTPEYVRSLRAAGFEPDVEEVIGMKSQDVTPEYIEQIRAMGFKPSADEVIAMKTHDITPQFVKSMRDMGMNPDANEIIALKVHDITPEYRRALEATGYELTVDEVIEAKVMDVTPEFINQARSHGFKDLTMEQIIQLKHAEVL
jgi:beta-lactamase regulating signal transducer with metallopeptidase domain